jgi:hypothetical protein
MEHSQVWNLIAISTGMSCVLFLAVYLFTTAFSSCLSKQIDDADANMAGLFLGFSLLIGLIASVHVGYRSLYFPWTLVLLGGLLWQFFKQKGFSSFSMSAGLWPGLALTLFNVWFHWIVCYDWKNETFLSDWIDSYIYSDNVNFLLKLKTETPGYLAESMYLGEGTKTSFYHYSEYYLCMPMKWLVDLPSHFLLFFVVMPFMVAISQLIIIYLVKPWWKHSVFWLLAFVLAGTTFFRYVHLFNLFELTGYTNYAIERFKNFPTYLITPENTIYPYSYSGKVVVFFIALLGCLALAKKSQPVMLTVALALTFVTNAIYLPFVLAFVLLMFWQEHRSFKDYAFILVGPALAYLYHMLVSQNSIPAVASEFKPEWQVVWSLKSTYIIFYKKFYWLVSNFYPQMCFTGLLWWITQKSKLSMLFLIYLVLLALVFLYSPSLIGVASILFWGIIGWLLIGQAQATPIQTKPYLLLVANLVFWLFNELTIAFRDVFQIHELSLITTIFLLPFLLIEEGKWSKWQLAVLSAIFMANNLFAVNFYFKRTYFRTENSAAFLEKYFEKTKGRLVKSLFINSVNNTPYIASEGRTGFDIKNMSDSLFQFYVSIETLTPTDSLNLKKALAWQSYQDQPFVQYYNKNKASMSLDSAKRSFCRAKGISAVFRSAHVMPEQVAFAKPLIVDSLENRVERYMVYFLK